VSRALKYDIPGPDCRVRPEDVAARGWDALFPPELPRPLRLGVDVGFGRGEFLLERARRDPEGAYVGLEVSFKRVLKMARRVARTDLRNLRIVEGPAEALLPELFAPEQVAVFWIHFPDPWPKKRHHRRRLVQPDLVRELARRLRPGGSVHVATDHAGYAEQIDEVLSAEPLLENAYAPARFLPDLTDSDLTDSDLPEREPTAYEAEWRAEGRPLHFFRYRRRVARASLDTSGGRP